MASAGEKPWSVDETSRVYGLQVILLQRIYVLPWSQFLYAEGTVEEVQAYFGTHVVVVRGKGLDALLADLATQQITVLRQPRRTDKFAVGNGPSVVEAEVKRVENSTAFAL